MPVTEYERHQLFTWFEEHMGTERATTMMNLVPPVGWADVATRHDLNELEARLTTRTESLERNVDLRFDAVDLRFDAIDRRFDVLEDRLGALEGRFDALQLDAKLGELRSELLRTFGTWLFASQAAVIAALSVLIALN